MVKLEEKQLGLLSELLVDKITMLKNTKDMYTSFVECSTRNTKKIKEIRSELESGLIDNEIKEYVDILKIISYGY